MHMHWLTQKATRTFAPNGKRKEKKALLLETSIFGNRFIYLYLLKQCIYNFIGLSRRQLSKYSQSHEYNNMLCCIFRCFLFFSYEYKKNMKILSLDLCFSFILWLLLKLIVYGLSLIHFLPLCKTNRYTHTKLLIFFSSFR